MLSKKKVLKIIGVNSGTSADALDISLVKFDGKSINLLSTNTFGYPTVLKKEILSSGPNSKIYDIETLSLKLGDFVSKKINLFIKKNKIQTSRIDAIGLHGQTIHHSQDFKKTLPKHCQNIAETLPTHRQHIAKTSPTHRQNIANTSSTNM